MSNSFNKEKKYYDILNLIRKNVSHLEPFLIIIKENFTNNIFYYFLCVIFRFSHILLFACDYSSVFLKSNNTQIVSNFLRKLTIYNILVYFQISYKAYVIINFFFYISFLIRTMLYFNLVNNIKQYKFTKKWPAPNKYRIITDHIVFLLFPYILEFISFPYYFVIFPEKSIIKLNNENKKYLILIMVLNAILIILYNKINMLYIYCTNKKFGITFNESVLRKNNSKKFKYNNIVAYRCSNFILFLYYFFQNLVLIIPLENNFNKFKHKIIFKAILNIIILLIILIIFFSRIYEYKYINFINNLINILLLFIFYTIVFDFIIFISKYKINNKLFEIIYIFIKFFFSYITYNLYVLRNKKYLESKIINILFQEKISDREDYIINSFYYFNEIMIKIRENNDIELIYILIGFLSNHINNCFKSECNCKILENVIKDSKFNLKDVKKIKNFITKLLNILNYLFESAFIEYEYYDKYELVILLSEHFCHLKKNSTMAFSIINTFFQKQKDNINEYDKIVLYELSLKYIYYMMIRIKDDIEVEIYNNKKEILINNQRVDYFKSFFNNLKLSYQVKKFIFNYIDNLIQILKYKNIFEESISFHYDENNENIISAKYDFLNKISNIENKQNENKTNLYYIINLLQKEKLYYYNLNHSIDEFEIIKDMPIFIIFKFYLFYDIIEGRKIPDNIANKLYSLVEKKINLNNNCITKEEYVLLKNKYNEQNNEKDSKYFSIFEYKKELRTKYFSEALALKLGYKQKDIINKKIDRLMPKEFYESHQNLMKQKMIAEQSGYFSVNNVLFDSNSNILFSIKFEALVVFSLSKNLEIISESSFIIEYEYKFMLNNNFELLAHSKNFEEEYSLNKKILQMYDIKLLDVLKITPLKLQKKFASIYKKINNQNIMRKMKIEEYLIPQLYSISDYKNNGNINSNNLNILKKNFISHMLNNEDDNINEGVYEEKDEKAKLINKEKMTKLIDYLVGNQINIIFHDSFNLTLSKKIFLENIAKELSKIPDNEIMYQNDKNVKLIIKAKELFDKLLYLNDISIDLINIKIKLSYYYDKPFYFVTINDEKKIYLKMVKEINYKNDYYSQKQYNAFEYQEQKSILRNSLRSKNKKSFPFRNNSSRKIIINSESIKTINTRKQNSILNITYQKDESLKNNQNEEKDPIGKINQYREIVNNYNFILIIRIIMTIIIVCIIIVYILLIYLKDNLINISVKIILTNFYIFQTRDIMLNVYSRLLQIYYELANISLDKLSTLEDQQYIISTFSNKIKDGFHNFSDYYYEYNININHNFNVIFDLKKFYKLIGFWEVSEYKSIFTTELDIIIFNIYSIDLLDNNSGMYEDIPKFLFYNNEKTFSQKIKSTFIKLLYYICKNYELTFKNIYNEIHEEIKSSYYKFRNSQLIKCFLLEGFVLLFYLIFFVSVLIYLYYANQVIIKNIIFLFLDFSEKEFDKYKSGNNNLITWKLLEFKNLIDDFNLDKFQRYKINLEKLNRSQLINLNQKDINDTNIIMETNNENETEATPKYSENVKNKVKPTKNVMLKYKNYKKLISMNDELFNKKKLSSNNIQYNNLNNKYNSPRNKINNTSSYNYLTKSSKSILSRNKISTNSIQASNNEFLNTNNNNTHSNNLNIQNNFKNKKSNSLKSNDNEEYKSYQDLLLNKTNKSTVLIVKIYIIIIFFLIILLTIFSIIKIKLNFILIQGLSGFFSDFTTVINRFSLLHYYFSIFRTIIILHDNELKNKIETILNNMTENYEDYENEYTRVLLNRIPKYGGTNSLFNILKETKKNSSILLKENICENEQECIIYLDSKYNIFDSGVDFSYKSCLSKIKNLYNDYKNLKNKTDIEEIKSNIINSGHSSFNQISVSISNFVLYVKSKIIQSFKNDQIIFTYLYSKKINIFNAIFIIFAILTILFVNIFIFYTISRFSRPVKESTYRLNCSFYYIKKYSLTNFKKSESIIL